MIVCYWSRGVAYASVNPQGMTMLAILLDYKVSQPYGDALGQSSPQDVGGFDICGIIFLVFKTAALSERGC